MDQLTIIQPDDFHVHLRDGAYLTRTVIDTVKRFARAIVMPNLNLPVTTVALAGAYRQRIQAYLPEGCAFEPLMTLYLTDNTPVDEIRRLKGSGYVHAVKYYPAGATTNSDAGVSAIEKVYDVIEALSELHVPLLIHGEVSDEKVDLFDREAVFIDQILEPLLQRYPGLKTVFEHITTREAVEYVREGSHNLAATITPHHLLFNRNALFENGIRPHHYCRPILKAEHHREALVEAATGDCPRFFLGTDSAPHARRLKETACGCAGIYSAHNALEFYAEAFEDAGKLPQLEQFASRNGAGFYGLPVNQFRCTLVRNGEFIPAALDFGEDTVIPLRAGESCRWRLATNE
ncbi:MAG: dihydroorotase [Gammaproteobacteria bacterium RIFCSPLOWO2_02_FULL_56_15]|nr:MAG: dihydroorotase [Gammaproteobacteria bacterium RIFCSPLOWO2_02_FULL_56_15]